MPGLEGSLHGLKADPSTRADDQDCRHGVILADPPGSPVMCDAGSRTASGRAASGNAVPVKQPTIKTAKALGVKRRELHFASREALARPFWWQAVSASSWVARCARPRASPTPLHMGTPSSASAGAMPASLKRGRGPFYPLGGLASAAIPRAGAGLRPRTRSEVDGAIVGPATAPAQFLR
jgi:hypothetical protein